MDEVALTDWLRRATGWADLSLGPMALLSGGAIQQNWRLDAAAGGARHAWVLRTDAPASLAASRSRSEEFLLLQAAFQAGVTVPEPLYLCQDAGIIGAPFFIMRRVQGTAAGHRIVRSETPGGGRVALVEALGRELARIHAMRPTLPFLGEKPLDSGRKLIATLREALDSAHENRPILEWGLRFLERRNPGPGEIVMCHNDYRTGNYMVSDAGITGILDWEFAAWGDPHADIGWLLARCWRFGSPHEVGGVGPRAPFLAAYQAASGRRTDPARIAWWQIAAAIRWAVIAIAQAERHVSGQEPSLELALTGHIVPELELDIMRATT
ncbi:MAG TPA: phosphotransferase family protein [Acetobacteraceae bacterium]|nr:phosphotransferase family protein [Acetobacteraceae bacterium]